MDRNDLSKTWVEISHSGVLIYKTASDCPDTRDQPREMDFMGRTAFTGSKFFYNLEQKKRRITKCSIKHLRIHEN